VWEEAIPRREEAVDTEEAEDWQAVVRVRRRNQISYASTFPDISAIEDSSAPKR
jgi:hypothetical protein